MVYFLLPLKRADGMISPNMSTRVTEMMMLANSGRRRFRKRGRHSLAMLLKSKRVTNS